MLLLYAIPACISLNNYISWLAPFFLLGVFTCCLASMQYQQGVRSIRYGIVALLLGILVCFFPIKTFFFFFTTLCIFFIIESFWGRLPFASLVSLVLLSPLFSHFILQFGFTIRLYLTACAGSILKLLVEDTYVRGNIIVMNGAEYAVDPACMGLNMMVTSLISAVLLIVILQKKYHKQLSSVTLILLLSVVAVFNIACNLIRILILSYYNILPENLLHDLTGLLCFVVYVLLPAYWLINTIIKKAAAPTVKNLSGKWSRKGAFGLHVVLGVSFLFACFAMYQKPAPISFNEQTSANGYTNTIIQEKGVLKMEHENVLLYVKPIPNCYTGEHHPTFCWTGSGYTFSNIKLNEAYGHRFYTAQLEKEKEVLYTAWWYDNGYTNTTEQWQWRWDMLRGKESYALINITTATNEDLQTEVQRFIDVVDLKQLWTKTNRK